VADENETYSPNAVHLMRTAQLAQLQLSAMADTKASILMGATFVIFTITIGRAQGANAPLPLLILGGAAFLSAIFTILAVLPAFKPKKASGKPNIMFFGTFTRMSEEAFIADLTSRLKTDHSVYETMARDIYQAGMVLQHKKYRMLGWAYRIFLTGLVASCASYVWIYLI
jgi:hypothetical protein